MKAASDSGRCRRGFSNPVRVMVLPRNVISAGGAGWIERKFGGAATVVRTWP